MTFLKRLFRFGEKRSQSLENEGSINENPNAHRSGKNPQNLDAAMFQVIKGDNFPGSLDDIKTCLNEGANVNATDRLGRTVLWYIICSEDVDFVRGLLEAGADPSIADVHGQTPLHEAVPMWSAKAFVEIIRLLVAYGADPNAKRNLTDGDQSTPLMCAAYHGREDVIDILLELGSDVFIKNQDGKDAIDIARENGHDSSVALISQFLSKGEGIESQLIADKLAQAKLRCANQADAGAFSEFSKLGSGALEQVVSIAISNDETFFVRQAAATFLLESFKYEGAIEPLFNRYIRGKKPETLNEYDHDEFVMFLLVKRGMESLDFSLS